MIVGEHGPETTQGYCGKVDAQLWQIAFEIGADESVALCATSGLVGGQQRVREPSSQPAGIEPAGARLDGRDFVQRQTVWGATIILSGRTTTMMAGGEESKAA